MSQAYVSKLTRLLQASAAGRYFVSEVRPQYQEDLRKVEREYILFTRKDKEVARMKVQSLPGCCGVCLLHAFSGAAADIATFISFAEKAAQKGGYGLLLLSLRANSDLLPLLPEFSGEDFRNGKTGNQLALRYKILPQQREERRPTNEENHE